MKMDLQITWLHCYKCNSVSNTKIKWFVASCGHIFCHICIGSNSGTKCLLCQQDVNMREIKDEMDPSTKEFFMPLNIVEKKVSERLQGSLLFQETHRNHFEKMVLQKYGRAKREYMNALNKIRALINEIKMLKHVIASNQNRSFPTSTPTMPGNPAMLSDNMSDLSSIRYTPGTTLKPKPGYASRIPAGMDLNSIKKMSVSTTPVYQAGGMYSNPYPRSTPLQGQNQLYKVGKKDVVPIHGSMQLPLSALRKMNVGKRT